MVLSRHTHSLLTQKNGSKVTSTLRTQSQDSKSTGDGDLVRTGPVRTMTKSNCRKQDFCRFLRIQTFRHKKTHQTKTETNNQTQTTKFRTMTIEELEDESPYRHSLETKRSVSDLTETFHKFGFLVLKQALPANALQEWHSFGQDYFDKCFESLYERGHTQHAKHKTDDGDYVLGLGAKHGFREIVMRSPGRYELSLLNFRDQAPATSDVLEPLSRLIPSLLGHLQMDNLKLCHLSLLVATPGSDQQGWHADGGHVNVTQHEPCHVLNVFVPLQDVTLQNGPTEFRPGTHYHTRNLAPMMLAAKCRNTLKPPYMATLEVGDVCIFDYRVLHRGSPNRSLEQNRNFLVLTFSQPWFEDILNFPKRTMMEQAEAPQMESKNDDDDDEKATGD
jgi:hypothetical protein